MVCGLTCPHSPHLVAKPRGAIKLFGRGGSALASLGLARYKSRAPLTRRLPPCRPRTGRGGTPCRPHTHKYGRGAISFSFSPLPQLSHAPDFLISCGACRSGHAGGVPLPANPSVGEQHRILVGAALRADRTQRTPWKGVPTNTMPGSLSRSINKTRGVSAAGFILLFYAFENCSG